jgi:hypothetical protein
MVQSNPEIHGPTGIYEAYKRMYAALGVDNVEALIKPPADNTPKPVDAGTENASLLMGKPAQAFEGQNHQAHLDTHKSLFITKVVQDNPQIQSVIISHCMQHLQFLAAQMSAEQMPEEVQMQIQEMEAQMQQVPQEQVQQMTQQIQLMKEQLSSPIVAQLTNEFLQSIGQGEGGDPLVEIRKAELDLKDKEMDIEAEQFMQKQNQRAQEKMQEQQTQGQRINVQKNIADDKLNVAIDRLKQNADLKLLEIETKMRN